MCAAKPCSSCCTCSPAFALRIRFAIAHWPAALRRPSPLHSRSSLFDDFTTLHPRILTSAAPAVRETTSPMACAPAAQDFRRSLQQSGGACIGGSFTVQLGGCSLTCASAAQQVCIQHPLSPTIISCTLKVDKREGYCSAIPCSLSCQLLRIRIHAFIVFASLFSCILYECTWIIISNEHTIFVVVCIFELSNGNSVSVLGRRLTQLVQLTPQLVDTSTSRNLLTCTKSNRGVCCAAQAGLTVTQLVLLNPQLVDNAAKTCRVAAGQTLCRGAGLPSRRVETNLIKVSSPCCPILGYICARHRLSVCCSRPEEPAQCGVHPDSCTFVPAHAQAKP